MKGLFRRWTAFILIGGILIQLLAGCSEKRSLPKSSDTRFQEKVISEQVITESGIAEEKLDESYIVENLVCEEGVYEYKISEDIISQAYVFEVTISEHTEQDIEAFLPDDLDEYDIDWLKVIGKFAVGTTIIIGVGIINHFSAGSTYFVFGSPATVARDAFVGGAIGAALKEVFECVKEGKAPLKAVTKYAIEGFAEGYMWGAISSVLKVSAENFKRLKVFKLATGGKATIRPNGTVFDEAGKLIGRAYYGKEGLWYLLDESTKAIQVFSKTGKAITDAAILSATKTLPSNAKLRLGPATDAPICYTDDLGQIMRTGNSLAPNLSYELNGYTYTTDDFGRIIEADFADLKLKNPERRFRLDILDSKQNIGKGFELTTDDRGHLIADMFDGNNTMANIVAMNSSVNQREVQAIENIWKLCLQDGGHVHGSIELTYTGESFRPDSFKYVYDIGKGEISETIINSIS